MNRTVFTVASYNIWHESYKVGGGITHNADRHHRIAELLRDQFDLIAVQEISQTAFDVIGKDLRNYWRAFQPHPNRKDGIAIFGKINQFSVLNVNEIQIQGGDSKSGILLNLIHKSTGKTINIASSHFKGGPYPDRAKGDLESAVVAKALDQTKANLKILAGDFNQGSKDLQNNRVTNVKQKFKFEEQTRNEYNTEPHNKRRIDYILYKTDDQTQVSVETMSPEFVDPFLQAQVSDHLPFVQTFEFEQINPPENQYIQPAAHNIPELPVKQENVPIPKPYIEPPNHPLEPIDQNNHILNTNPAQTRQNQSISKNSSWQRWLNSFWDGIISCIWGVFRSCGLVA
jgi:endonuclease/exonuclease/phosphatase family metal-dependent hydrolase